MAATRERVGTDQTAATAPRVRTGRLPTGRAVVGAMMVATAAATVLVAHRAASQPPTTRFVVLTQAVDAGQAVTADDLGTIAAQVPDELSVVPEEQADEMIGRVARTTLQPMDLLRTTDLFDAGRFTSPGATEVAVELRPAQALLDTIAVGDLVDVLSTDPDDQGTATIARAVRVSAVRGDGDDGGIGATGTVRVRLGVPDASTAEALVDAAVRTELTLAMPAPDRAQEAP